MSRARTIVQPAPPLYLFYYEEERRRQMDQCGSIFFERYASKFLNQRFLVPALEISVSFMGEKDAFGPCWPMSSGASKILDLPSLHSKKRVSNRKNLASPGTTQGGQRSKKKRPHNGKAHPLSSTAAMTSSTSNYRKVSKYRDETQRKRAYLPGCCILLPKLGTVSVFRG